MNGPVLSSRKIHPVPFVLFGRTQDTHLPHAGDHSHPQPNSNHAHHLT